MMSTMAPASPVQGEAVRLMVGTVLAVTLMLLWRRPTRDERGQSVDVAFVLLGLLLRARMLRALVMRLWATIGLRLAWRIRLPLARREMLRLAGTIAGLVSADMRSLALIIGILVGVVALLLLASALRSVIWLALPELLMRGRNHAEVMLGMLIIILCRDWVAGRLRVTRKLNVFLGNMVRGAADFYVRPVRLVNPSEWIVMVTLAVAPPHTLVLSVSHGSPIRQPLVCGGIESRSFTKATEAPSLKAAHTLLCLALARSRHPAKITETSLA
jgi:hypothetical protein